MKLIEEVSLWDNGNISKATILNAYAVNVSFDKSATFWYGLFAKTEDGLVGNMLTQGNIGMSGEDYANWNSDDVAWNFIASKLNLVIVGDFNEPTNVITVPEDVTSAEVIETPSFDETLNQ